MDSFSGHGDQHEMYNYLKNQTSTVQKLFLVHGDERVMPAWKDFLNEKGFNNVTIPSLGQEIDI